MSDELLLFALSASRPFAEDVARSLGTSLAACEEREFGDGEHKTRPLQNVRGRDVFVVQSLHGDAAQTVNDKLVRLLFFIGALRDASAARVHAVVPYLAYARKDRKSKPRDPVTTRYVAELFEAVGTDGVVTLDVHNVAAYQNAFRCRAENLEGQPLFARHFAAKVAELPVAVVSPDLGGVKRADAFRQRLEHLLGRPVAAAIAEKYRSEDVVSGEAFVGDVKGRAAIIIDDLIAGGTTVARAAQACRRLRAERVYVAATHGVFTEGAGQTLAGAAIDEIVVTDSIATVRDFAATCPATIVQLSVAPLFAEAIRRLHTGGSIVDLLAT